MSGRIKKQLNTSLIRQVILYLVPKLRKLEKKSNISSERLAVDREGWDLGCETGWSQGSNKPKNNNNNNNNLLCNIGLPKNIAFVARVRRLKRSYHYYYYDDRMRSKTLHGTLLKASTQKYRASGVPAYKCRPTISISWTFFLYIVFFDSQK